MEESTSLGQLFERYKDEKEISVETKDGYIKVYPQQKIIKGMTKAKFWKKGKEE